MRSPFDGRFKGLAGGHPYLLLRLFSIIRAGAKPQVIDVLRELQLDAVQIDHAYRIGDERIVHLEAITNWHAERVPRLALYRFLLKIKFKLPVSSYLILMAEKYAPANLPERIVYAEADGFRIETPYETIRLWEIDPQIAFEPGCEPLLPWVPLLKGGAAEVEQAVAAIARLSDQPASAPYPVETMFSNLAVLATLRYDRDAIRMFLEGVREKVMLSTDLFTESWLYQEGRAEGKAEGGLTAKREDLRLVWNARFPGSEAPPELDRITSAATLDRLLSSIVRAQNADEARRVVLTSIE